MTGESPPSLSKDLTSSLASVGDVSFDADSQFPLDELKIDPLTLDGLHMLNDPDMVLTDPATEDTFRMDRLWACECNFKRDFPLHGLSVHHLVSGWPYPPNHPHNSMLPNHSWPGAGGGSKGLGGVEVEVLYPHWIVSNAQYCPPSTLFMYSCIRFCFFLVLFVCLFFGIQLSWLVANVHFLFVLMYFVYSFWFRKHIALILWFTLFLLGLLIHIYFSVYNYFCHIKWIATLRLF